MTGRSATSPLVASVARLTGTVPLNVWTSAPTHPTTFPVSSSLMTYMAQSPLLLYRPTMSRFCAPFR